MAAMGIPDAGLPATNVRVEEHHTGAVWITVDRANKHNALARPVLADMAAAVGAAGARPQVRYLVVTGAGDKYFAAGGDLRDLAGVRDEPAVMAMMEEAGAALDAIRHCPVPVIAYLNGDAIGGGAELALACDMRVADVRAKLSFKQVRMGVTTAWGTVPRLVALVGAGTAARLLYASHEIGAAEAKLIGLVDDVTENGLARTTALAWASDIAEGSPRAIADMKRILRETTSTARDVRALERQVFIDTWSGADHAEAVEAYFERRHARWHER